MSNFITNAHGKNLTLKKRLHDLIAHSEELKFLVGFFYLSGWRELYEALKAHDDLRLKILVGLEVDTSLGRVVEIADPQADSRSQADIAERFLASLHAALNDEALDTQEFYEQVAFFLQMIEDGRLEIRKTFEPNHAKLYLFRLNEAARILLNRPGRFITGSSNLTRAGLLGQQEFNVEIGDYGWDEAEAYFDALWDDAVPITAVPQRKDDLLRIVRQRTQVAQVTPFEAYVMVLQTYLDLMAQREVKPHVLRLLRERGYKSYTYQTDAVNQALTILEQYNGVIIADVVGLGKSVIASLLARHLGGRGLVICPPALMGDRKTRASGWYKYLADFLLYDWDVYSAGKLDDVLAYLEQYGDDVETVIVDEAHRFRNEDTQNYELLSAICRNRRVILLTATPFSNTPSDVFALLKLFVPPGKSTITLDENLAARFARYSAEFRRLSHIIRYHDAGGSKQKRAERFYTDIFEVPLPIDLRRVRHRAGALAAEIRAVIEPVLIRRNRLDLKNDPVYSREITELSTVADPKELFFTLSPAQSDFYDRVARDYFSENGRFKGAIYQPFAYEKSSALAAGLELDEQSNRNLQLQRNLYDFMRRLLVKRFESSFGAFAQSIQNFIHVHEIVLAFVQKTGRYVLDRALIEKIWQQDEEEIESALQTFARRLAEKENPNPHHDRIYHLDEFDDKGGFLQDTQSDLQLFRAIAAEINALGLVDDDPKAERLIAEIRTTLNAAPAEGEPRRKVVVFSEYRDTVRHIGPLLETAFPGQVLIVDGSLSRTLAEQILLNFDASVPPKKQQDQFQILLTSDKLSEGINLNRAGAVFNYDIPWNPTRVIQRVGRINRIGRKVFDTLYIYNFFPTAQGADIVHSREIAAQKMFLIHNTLGEDAKIFAPDETPSPSELFRRINRNPEEEEEESLFTRVRRLYTDIQAQHSDVVEKVRHYPARVKTARRGPRNDLLVFRRKGLGLYVHRVADTTAAKPEVAPQPFARALEDIICPPETPRLALSPRFWPAYEAIKRHRDVVAVPLSDNALESKARNNLQSALSHHREALGDLTPFIRTLLEDLNEYQTLPKYTLRRFTLVPMDKNAGKRQVQRFINEVRALRKALGDDYLERTKQRVGTSRSEIIIAIEGQRDEAPQ